MTKTRLAAVAATATLIGLTGGSLMAPADSSVAAISEDPGYVPGDCGGSVAPQPDPCEAAQGALRYTFLAHLVNAQLYKNWKRDNGNEFNRFKAYLEAPFCPVVGAPAQPAMLTKFGAALINVFQAYACAKGGAPVDIPAPQPAPTGTDRTPPTAPSGLTVSP